MAGPRGKPRYTKRLEATFSAGPFTFRGILSDISESGLFIRTSHGFAPGTVVDIEIIVATDQVSRLKGIVRRSFKTPLSTKRNGMGIELTQKDAVFMNFLKSHIEESATGLSVEKEPTGEEIALPDFHILVCPGCGVKNKLSHEKLLLGPKCGKCRTPLFVT